MQLFTKKISQVVPLLGTLVVVVFLAALMFVVAPRPAAAQAPFGGMVTSVFYCRCSNNFRLTVSPPVGGTFMYQPGATTVYQFFRIPVVGVWLLGLYTSPVACLVPRRHGCSFAGMYPMILMTGTSM